MPQCLSIHAPWEGENAVSLYGFTDSGRACLDKTSNKSELRVSGVVTLSIKLGC